MNNVWDDRSFQPTKAIEAAMHNRVFSHFDYPEFQPFSSGQVTADPEQQAWLQDQIKIENTTIIYPLPPPVFGQWTAVRGAVTARFPTADVSPMEERVAAHGIVLQVRYFIRVRLFAGGFKMCKKYGINT